MRASSLVWQTPPSTPGPFGGIATGRLSHVCPRCSPSSTEARDRRHLLDLLLALLEHPDALPPVLALRLGLELSALAADGHHGFVCEAMGDSFQ
ncbi:hypothetical protein V5F77_16460 [Xanthobacter sp. DSM 24535]|uniref:hypothetical protein n=1 Tax=Roseixanthobacter psychrophilus TaxID=3119917 RepID=UPI00372A6690